MTEQNQSLREDIAFVRQMAEAGRDKPMVGGQILAACGLIFGAASLAVWVMAEVLRMPTSNAMLSWLVSGVVWVVVLIPMIRRTRRETGGLQGTVGAAWAGVGYAVFAMFVSLIVIGQRLEVPYLMVAFPSVLMALYGAAWSVAATAFRKRWMHLVAIASFVMAPVNGWFAGSMTIYLVYAISLFGLLTAPGLYLIRQARRGA
jgi:hypothetical protein